jgi:antitoxin CptB
MLNRVTANAAIFPVPNDRQALDGLRRKLEFRAWRRGTSEADLLIGAFADQCLGWFDAEELRQFERLLDEDDPVIDDWVTDRQLVPKEHDNRVMNLLRRFHLAISDRSRSGPPPRLTPRCSHSPSLDRQEWSPASRSAGSGPSLSRPGCQAEWREG